MKEMAGNPTIHLLVRSPYWRFCSGQNLARPLCQFVADSELPLSEYSVSDRVVTGRHTYLAGCWDPDWFSFLLTAQDTHCFLHTHNHFRWWPFYVDQLSLPNLSQVPFCYFALDGLWLETLHPQKLFRHSKSLYFVGLLVPHFWSP